MSAENELLEVGAAITIRVASGATVVRAILLGRSEERLGPARIDIGVSRVGGAGRPAYGVAERPGRGALIVIPRRARRADDERVAIGGGERSRSADGWHAIPERIVFEGKHRFAHRIHDRDRFAIVREVPLILARDHRTRSGVAQIVSSEQRDDHAALAGLKREARGESKRHAFVNHRSAERERRGTGIDELDELKVARLHTGQRRGLGGRRRKRVVVQLGEAEEVLRSRRHRRIHRRRHHDVLLPRRARFHEVDRLTARGELAGIRTGDQTIFATLRARRALAEKVGIAHDVKTARMDIAGRSVEAIPHERRKDGAAPEGELHRALDFPARDVHVDAARIFDDEILLRLIA